VAQDFFVQPGLIVRSSNSPKENAAPTTTAAAVVAKTALFGVAGWAAENLLHERYYSPVFRGHKVPFLPVYAAGGLAVIAAAPYLRSRPAWLRGLVYAGLGTAIEYAGCQLDRTMFKNADAGRRPGSHGRSWDYGEVDGLAESTDGCLSWKHTALWGGLGLLAEKFA
jgi:hypothetical protein